MGNGYPGRLAGLWKHPSVLLNVVAPVIAYRLLAGHGVTETDALAASAVFPAAGGVLVMMRGRRIDPLAVLSLTAIAIGLVTGLAFHDGRVLLVKDSLTSGTLGAVCLISLLTPKPVIFTLRRRLYVPDRRETLTEYDRTWQSQAIRAEARRTTAIWGFALLAEAALRVGLSYVLSAATLVTISTLLPVITLAPLALWTLRPRTPRLDASDQSDACDTQAQDG